jgi:ribonucleoside-diphosphate reductase subunit M2
MNEPILSEDNNRFVLFPIEYPDVYAMYKKAIDCFWNVNEIDLSHDLTDWNKLTDNEKYFIKMVLAFFAGSDGLIIENLGARFMTEVKVAEIKAFYGFQIAMENIHSETYSLLIETYVKDKTEKIKLFNAIDNFPCIKKKADWCESYIKNIEADFATRLVAFACVEGIFFLGLFVVYIGLKNEV